MINTLKILKIVNKNKNVLQTDALLINQCHLIENIKK
jgi:hypothetical protein